MTDIIDDEFKESANKLAEMMANGGIDPEAYNYDPEEDKFTFTVSEDESVEMGDIKKNVEYTINSSREMIGYLKRLAITTGNARYFEVIGTFLNTINSSMSKVTEYRKANGGASLPAVPSKPREDRPQIVHNTQTNININKPMSTKEALELAEMDTKPVKLINVSAGETVDD